MDVAAHKTKLKNPYQAALMQLELAQMALASGHIPEAVRAVETAWTTLQQRSALESISQILDD